MRLTRLLCTAFVLSLCGFASKAEVTVQLGNGNSSLTTTGPWRQLQANNKSKKVMLFTEAELAAQGIVPGVILHAMKWYKTTNDSFINGASATATLYMRAASYPQGYGNSNYNVLGHIGTGFTQVATETYNQTHNISMSDWVGFTDFYYTYTGGDLEVYVDWKTIAGTSYTTTTGSFKWKYGSGNLNKYLSYHGTPYNSSDFSISNDRPNTLMVFTIPSCSTAPIAGAAVSDAPGALCQGQTFGLTLTGNSTSTSQSYKWQQAPTANGPWTTYSLPLQQPLIGIAAPASTTWYRAKVSCGSLYSYSTAVEVQVNGGLSGGTYTIDHTQPTGNGNFHTFQDAVIALGCGITGPVTFNVAAGSGPYNEQIVIPQIGGASIINTITFNGNGATISNISSAPNERAVIKLDGADYITINDLNIEVTGAIGNEFGYGVHIIHNADLNTIRNCHIMVNTTPGSNSSDKYAGIVINGHAEEPLGINYTDCDINIITNNTITGGYYGIILLGNSESSTITGNVLTRNTINDFYAYGIYAGNNSTAIIEGNDISRPARTNGGNFTGILLKGYNASSLLLGNKIHGAFDSALSSENSATAINLDGCNPAEGSENIIANNVVYGIRSKGSQYGIMASGSAYTKFQHNTVAMDHAEATCDDCGVYGFYQAGADVSNLDFSNNIISLRGDAEGDMRAMHFSGGINGTTFNNNNYYLASGGSIGSISGQNYSSLLLWKVGVLGDLLSVSKNPMYQDPTSGNMRPTNASLDNAGFQMGILVDITGTLRNLTTPDVGAYEFDENTLRAGALEVATPDLNIYPNPATGMLYAQFSQKVTMTVSGIDGRILLQKDNTNSMDISGLAAGIYILKVSGKDGALLATEKILKQDK